MKIDLSEKEVELIVSALNIAYGVTSVHAKGVHGKILAAGLLFDERINDALEADAGKLKEGQPT